MTIPDDASKRIETYLDKLRGRLRGVNDAEVCEIVEELRSHIVDKAVANGEVTEDRIVAALAALGNPEELAGQYMTDNLLARAEVSRSPVRILQGLFRWASLSVAGFFVLLGSIVGYFAGGVFILVAVCKPFHPQTAGLWTYRDNTGDLAISFRLGYGNAPGPGTDLLGWWVLPVGLLASCGLVMLTTRVALWCVRLYRRTRTLPGS